MSEMKDKSSESPEEDSVSLRSNGNDGSAKSLGRMQSIRRSFRLIAEKSPLSPGAKGSKVAQKTDAAGNESGLRPPPSPSLSAGSPVTSPLKTIGNLFNKKDEDESDDTSQKGLSLKRSKTDPSMSPSTGESFVRRSFRRLKFAKKVKDENGKDKPEVLGAVREVLMDEKTEQEKEEEKEEEVELDEMYILPDLPHTPLSVMQISKLIENEVLEEAHLNLLALRHEFQQERESGGDDSMELAKKEKDLNLLYGDMRSKIKAIVRDSNSLPSRNKGLLVHVARIIQEEKKRAEEPGGIQENWMDIWRESVDDGVRVKVEGVHLDQKDQNPSWLSVHLGLLGKTIVEDLEGVKRDLRWSYPPSFKVFSTYVKSYHQVVAQHLKKLEPQVTELKDLYALLDWIINRYKSEKIMGNVSLQPEMMDESSDLQLEENFLKQLKEKYCATVKVDMKSSLDRIINLENEEMWKDGKSPEKEEAFLNSQFHMDIWTKVKSNCVNSQKIDAQLEQKAVASCLEELKHFPKRFEVEFTRLCGALRPQPLWTEYQITYINGFTSLQQHMENYLNLCPKEVEDFRREVKWLIVHLSESMENQFKEEVKPYLRRMMTRKWLTVNEDFDKLLSRTTLLSEQCALMRPPHVQELVSRLHYHVVKEYIGQLMKNNYSCKNRKHEKAAEKIRRQWERLMNVFEDMNSTQEWLYPVGDHLSDIIGQKNKTDIKDHIEPLVKHYPDFGRKHLVAVLNFRGLLRGREHRLILQRFTQLKKNQPNANANGAAGESGVSRQVLFSDMQVTVNTDCLSNLPFSCFSFLLPDN